MSGRQKCVSTFWKLLQARSYQTAYSSSNSSNCLGKQLQQWLAQPSNHTTSSSTPCAGLYHTARQQLQSQFRRGISTGEPTKLPPRIQRPPPPEPNAGGPAAAAAGSKAATGAAGSAASKAAGGAAAELSPFEQWRQKWQRVPTVPKWLGLAGAIPFIALAPPVCKHLEWVLPTTVTENCAMIQVCYGVVIVTFLGAVHWGVAMATPLTSHIAVKLANESFVYSVIPSLVAWPIALMEPGVGSMLLSLLLPGCYMADYTRRNLGMPAWYMTLRVLLTVMATFGMLLTATRSMYLWQESMREAEQKEAQQQQA